MERLSEDALRRDIEIGIALILAGLAADADRAELLLRLGELGAETASA
jgi:hypothetical protein